MNTELDPLIRVLTDCLRPMLVVKLVIREKINKRGIDGQYAEWIK